MDKLCDTCQRPIKPKADGYDRKRCNPCTVSDFRQRTEIKAVAYLGGQCRLCGYSRCLRALSFHHRDPSEKEFGISRWQNLAWKKIEAELDKCILLCANCHMEVHAGISYIQSERTV